MASYDVKLTLSRSQRRLLDGAAKASGLKTGPWVRLVALDAAKPQPEPQAAPAVKLPGFGPSNPIRTAAQARSLVQSFDPDKA